MSAHILSKGTEKRRPTTTEERPLPQAPTQTTCGHFANKRRGGDKGVCFAFPHPPGDLIWDLIKCHPFGRRELDIVLSCNRKSQRGTTSSIILAKEEILFVPECNKFLAKEGAVSEERPLKMLFFR